MRLDKFLCEMNVGTRSQVKTFVRQGLVTVNGLVAGDCGKKVDEEMDRVAFRGQLLGYSKYVYYMLNKPAGTVSATRDNTAPTAVSLLGKEQRTDLFPVGRLDKDATGLLLLTNDGDLAHRLLSPKYHVDKTYEVTMAHELTAADVAALEQGLDIGEDQFTLPAKVKILEEKRIYLTLHEGKFHQVKRMLKAVENQVTALKRVSFGGLTLDDCLAPGEYRQLRPEELTLLQGQCHHA